MKTIDILTLRPLELLHMDIMCPTKTKSLGEKKVYYGYYQWLFKI